MERLGFDDEQHEQPGAGDPPLSVGPTQVSGSETYTGSSVETVSLPGGSVSDPGTVEKLEHEGGIIPDLKEV